MESTDAVPTKKRKTDCDSDHGDGSPPVLDSFKGFDVEKVISENTRSKTATIHAKCDGKDAIVLLEKSPFNPAHVKNYFTEETTLKNTLKNDIYGTYEAFLPPIENGNYFQRLYYRLLAHVVWAYLGNQFYRLTFYGVAHLLTL